MTLDNNGKTIERAILIVGLVIQILLGAVAYGKLSQQVGDLGSRIERVERYIDSRIEHGQKP